MKSQAKVGVAVLGVLLLLSLAGCKDKAPESPETYTIGADSAPSFDTVLTKESGGVLTSITPLDEEGNEIILGEEDADAPKDEDGGEDAPTSEATDTAAPAITDDATTMEPKRYAYVYSELESGGAPVESYVQVLTGDEHSFKVIGEDGEEAELPSFASEAGEVRLLKASADEGNDFRISVKWTKGTATVTAMQSAAAAEQSAEPETMTMGEAATVLQRYSPGKLGLAGDDIKKYRMYPSDGIVMVDDTLCVRVQVFSKMPDGENHAEGTFLISGDQTAVYRLDEDAGTVTLITEV